MSTTSDDGSDLVVVGERGCGGGRSRATGSEAELPSILGGGGAGEPGGGDVLSLLHEGHPRLAVVDRLSCGTWKFS